MPISGVTTNYTGRKKDISIFFGPRPLDSATQKMSIKFGKPSAFIAGVQKVIQRYAIAMLTKLGSQENYLDFGTSFLTNLQNSSSVVSKNDVEHFFNYANISVLDNFRQYQADNKDFPLDEQIDTATLINYLVGTDSVSFNIQIVTQAGETIEFVLPVPDQTQT